MGTEFRGVTGEQVAVLVRRFVDINSATRAQRVLDNGILELVANGGLSLGDLRRLKEERYLPLEDFDAEDSWGTLVAQLQVLHISWRRLCLRITDPSGEYYEPLSSLYSAQTFGELEPFWEHHDKWLIHMPATR